MREIFRDNKFIFYIIILKIFDKLVFNIFLYIINIKAINFIIISFIFNLKALKRNKDLAFKLYNINLNKLNIIISLYNKVFNFIKVDKIYRAYYILINKY